jgi:hypothetical protein
MAGPQGSEFLSVPLTNFSVGLMEQMPSVARRLLPRVPVDQQTGTYYVIPRGSWLRNEAKPLARASESAGGGWVLADDTYSVIPRAFHKDNDDQDYLNASAQRIINLDRAATRFVTQAMITAEDNQFAATFLSSTATAWDLERTGDAAPASAAEFLFWDDADATPVADVRNAATTITRATGGRRPNTLVVPPAVHEVLVEHPTIVGRIQSGLQAVGEPELARLFGVENYVVAWGVTNSAAEGLTDDFDFTFAENVLLAYFNPSAGPENQTAGALFSWTGFDGPSDVGTRIDRYRIPEKHVFRIEGFDGVDMKITDPTAGALFIDTLT